MDACTHRDTQSALLLMMIKTTKKLITSVATTSWTIAGNDFSNESASS